MTSRHLAADAKQDTNPRRETEQFGGEKSRRKEIQSSGLRSSAVSSLSAQVCRVRRNDVISFGRSQIRAIQLKSEHSVTGTNVPFTIRTVLLALTLRERSDISCLKSRGAKIRISVLIQ